MPYSNRKLGNAIDKLIEIGFLISQSAKKFMLNDDYRENLEIYLKKAMNNKNEVI